MLERTALDFMNAARSTGMGKEAGAQLIKIIIPWQKSCHNCNRCDYQEKITAHGWCHQELRYVSPHYFCDRWEQD